MQPMQERTLDSSFDDVAQALAPEIRSAAREAGWPEEVVLTLTVENRNGRLVPSVPDRFREVVEDLEFGTETGAPTGVLHKTLFSHTARDRVKKETDKSLSWLARDLQRMFR